MKTTQIISLVFVLIILGCSIKPNSDSETAKIIKIDDVIENPENFKGTISVSGIVFNPDKSKKYFEIGCEDACVYLPVQFQGDIPQNKKEIILTGTLIKDTDKYYFKANNFKEK
jgi:cytochrome c-type biogenesis protein CcmE